jgi:hypothetical protein
MISVSGRYVCPKTEASAASIVRPAFRATMTTDTSGMRDLDDLFSNGDAELNGSGSLLRRGQKPSHGARREHP